MADKVQCVHCGSMDTQLKPTLSGPRQFKCNACRKVFYIEFADSKTLREGISDVREV